MCVCVCVREREREREREGERENVCVGVCVRARVRECRYLSEEVTVYNKSNQQAMRVSRTQFRIKHLEYAFYNALLQRECLWLAGTHAAKSVR